MCDHVINDSLDINQRALQAAESGTTAGPRRTGGSAANVARCMARLGAASGAAARFIGMAGADAAADEFAGALREHGVEPLLARSTSGAATATCLCLVGGVLSGGCPRRLRAILVRIQMSGMWMHARNTRRTAPDSRPAGGGVATCASAAYRTKPALTETCQVDGLKQDRLLITLVLAMTKRFFYISTCARLSP